MSNTAVVDQKEMHKDSRKKDIWLRYITLVFTIGVTVFIFAMSSKPAEISTNISVGTTETTLKIFTYLPFLYKYREQVEWIAKAADPFVRKGAHFTEFFVLGISCYLMFINWIKRIVRVPKAVIALLYCALIASLDETLQLFVEGRFGCVTDVMIDCSGAILGILIIMVITRVRKKVAE